MILELAQLLGTAHWELTIDHNPLLVWKEQGLLYKATHKNHPCAKWVRETVHNYRFLVKLGLALCDEYYYRYGKDKNKQHKTRAILEHLKNHEPNYILSNEPRELLQPMNITKPPLAMPDTFKDSDTLISYRQYYRSEQKAHLKNWKKREQPDWFC
jgi:hypothetical protein